MWGSEMKTNEMKNLNGNKHREKETEINGGLRITASHWGDPLPLNVYSQNHSVKGEQGDRHSGPRCPQHS